MSALAHTSDEELMRRVGGDDTRAFEELYDRYVRLALRVARTVCPDAGRAEESVQEAFLSIWRARQRYRAESGSFKAWALTVVRHRAVDLVRRDAAWHRSEQGVRDSEAGRPELPSPPEAAIASNEGESLRGFLSKLPESQSEVVALAFFGGLTHTEIAAQLQLPEGTVKGRMRLGMHKLRADMEGLDSAAPDP